MTECIRMYETYMRNTLFPPPKRFPYKIVSDEDNSRPGFKSITLTTFSVDNHTPDYDETQLV